LLAAALAQNPQNATFRAGTQEVLVDAAVFDKKGNFQGDLTRDDFQLLEDGKPQKITSFSLAGASTASGRDAHFVALVFESEEEGLRDEVSQFVRRAAAPDLYFAVFSRVNGEMRLALPFTTNAARVEAALKEMQIVPPMPMPGPEQDRIFIGPGRQNSPVLDRITSAADAVAPIRGRKVLFLFSYGMFGTRGAPVLDEAGRYIRTPVPPMARFVKQAIDECNADNVAVYSFVADQRRLTLGGDYYSRPEDPSEDHGGATDFVRDLALGTGGKYTPDGDYDMAAYLGNIAASQNDYYLLGYTPATESATKPCHKLRVKVARSGLEVTARDSYCTSDRPPERALKSAEKALESRPTTVLPAPGLQLSWFYSKPGTAIVDLAMDLDFHGKQFNLLGVVYREDGSVATRLGDTVKLDADAPTPYRYSRQLNLPPGRYRIRVTVGSGGEPFGAAERTIEIAPWDGESLSASGIALSVNASRITDVTAALSNSMLDGPHRMASQGWKIEPMGGSEFHAGANATLYFEIYAPHDAAVLAPRMRIVDRANGEQKTDSGPMDIHDFVHAGDRVIPVVLTLPVSKLTAGSYTLEVRIGDNVLRTADFEVRP
jgi:VWFA-related protein